MKPKNTKIVVLILTILTLSSSLFGLSLEVLEGSGIVTNINRTCKRLFDQEGLATKKNRRNSRRCTLEYTFFSNSLANIYYDTAQQPEFIPISNFELRIERIFKKKNGKIKTKIKEKVLTAELTDSYNLDPFARKRKVKFRVRKGHTNATAKSFLVRNTREDFPVITLSSDSSCDEIEQVAYQEYDKSLACNTDADCQNITLYGQEDVNPTCDFGSPMRADFDANALINAVNIGLVKSCEFTNFFHPEAVPAVCMTYNNYICYNNRCTG